MLVEADLSVDCPLEQVFDALADLRNEPAWDPRVTGVELLTGEPVGQDSRFAMQVAGERYDAVVRRHQRPHVLEVSGTGRPMTWRRHLVLIEGAAATTVIVRFERHSRGPARLLEPFRVRAFRREVDAWTRAVKAHCEQR